MSSVLFPPCSHLSYTPIPSNAYPTSILAACSRLPSKRLVLTIKMRCCQLLCRHPCARQLAQPHVFQVIDWVRLALRVQPCPWHIVIAINSNTTNNNSSSSSSISMLSKAAHCAYSAAPTLQQCRNVVCEEIVTLVGGTLYRY